MKVAPTQRDVQLSEGMVAQDFTLSANAKMFAILADRLYSDKPRAVIREICANALDAHAMVGQTKPFLVAMPSLTEPMLTIRDFGPGMSHDDVMNRFTSFGDSSKDDDPNQIGGFGLGAKSPFAYTDAFTVTAFQGGKKRLYAAFRGSDAIPKMTFAGEEDTDEEDGIEVRVPVLEADFQRFVTTATDVLSYFPEGSFTPFGFHVDAPSYSTVKDNYRILAQPGRSHIVLIGPVAYPLDWSQIIPPDDAKVLSKNIVPTFSVNELDLLPSREGLSYDPRTIERLRDHYVDICREMGKDLYNQAIKTTTYEQMKFMVEAGQNGTRHMIQTYQKTEGVKPLAEMIVLPDRPELILLQPRGYRRGYYSTAASTMASIDVTSARSAENTEEQVVYAHLANKNYIFVFDDMLDVVASKKRLTARLKYFYTKSSTHKKVIFLLFDDKTPAVTSIDQIRQLFDGYGEAVFYNLSELPLPPVNSTARPKAEKVPGAKIAVRVLEFSHTPRYWDNRKTDWVDTGREVDSGVYVPLKGYELEDPNDAEWLKYAWCKVVPIYGLSKTARDNTNMDNFEHVKDFIKRMQVEALEDQAVLQEMKYRVIRDEIRNDNHLKSVSEIIGTNGVPGLERLCAKLNPIMQPVPAKVTLTVDAIYDYVTKVPKAKKLPKFRDTERVIPEMRRTLENSVLLQLALRCYRARDYHLFNPRNNDLLSQLHMKKRS